MTVTARAALVALLASATAVPAIAQYENASRAGPPPRQVPTTEDEQPQQGQTPGIKPSRQAQKAIIELQKAVNANDTANIPARLAAAQAAATTREDKYIVAQFQIKISAARNDIAGVQAAVDAIAASGMVDQAKVAQLYRGVGGSYYNAKQYDQAAAAFARAAALNPADVEAQKLIGEARFAQGNKAEALTAFQKVIAARKAAGQKADEELYKRIVQIAYDTKAPSAPQLAREWVAAYPSPDSWRNSIAIYRNLSRPDVEGTLSLLRLMRAAGAMTSPSDYALYVNAAADQLNFNEAQVVIDEGAAAKKIDPASPQFRQIKSRPKATAADLAEASKTAQSGMALLRIGDRYYALGEHAKAVELYRKAMGKPGVDADVANLHIGIALTAAGDKAGAAQAFNAVKGARADIAQYWLLFLQSRA